MKSLVAAGFLTLLVGFAAPARAEPPSAEEAVPTLAVPGVRVSLRPWREGATTKLYLRETESRWLLVCPVACKTVLPRGAEVRVTLGDSPEPHDFTLATDLGPDLDIEVRPASKGPLAGGIVMLSVGGLTALIGLTLFGASLFDSPSADDFRLAGVITTVIGGGLTVGGIALISNRSLEPRVRQDEPSRRLDSKRENDAEKLALPRVLAPASWTFSF